MFHSVSHHNRKDSTSSDHSDEISRKKEKNRREKYDSKDSQFSDKPRLSSRTSSSNVDSDDDTSSSHDHHKIKQSFGAKIKKNWQQVKNKLSGSSRPAYDVKIRTSDKAPRSEYADPDQHKVKVWRDKGRELMINAKELERDFIRCANWIDEFAQKAQWDVEENNFANDGQRIEFEFACPIDKNYACLGFDFNILNWTDEALGSLKILGNKSVITSTATQEHDFLQDETASVGRTEYALTKPVLLAAREIGSKRFVDEVLTALREIPAHCPVILDARGNDLGPAELNQLVDVMEKHPVIYQLNLNDNTFCTGEESCKALKRLFDALGPVTHLYLRNTGLNDKAAKHLQATMIADTCLRHVDVRSNNINDFGAGALIHVAAWRSQLDYQYAPPLDTILLQGNPCAKSSVTAGYLIDAMAKTMTVRGNKIILKTLPVQLDYFNADFSPIARSLKESVEDSWIKESEIETFYSSSSDNS